jgi:hypothetical protein
MTDKRDIEKASENVLRLTPALHTVGCSRCFHLVEWALTSVDVDVETNM